MNKDTNQIWEQVWEVENAKPLRYDPMGLFLSHVIRSEFLAVRRHEGAPARLESAIEMGAGSGRTSRYLNEMGAATGILDVSAGALRLARYANENVKNEVRFYQEDFFRLGPESLDRKYEVVWNAGVLEHFPPERQTEIVRRMESAMADGGVILMFTPFSGSVFYRLGKFVLEALGRFPYGEEVPVRTLAPVLPENFRLVRPERSVGFVILAFNGFKALANIPGMRVPALAMHRWVSALYTAALSFAPSRALIFAVDRVACRIFGGYLLLTVCARKTERNSSAAR